MGSFCCKILIELLSRKLVILYQFLRVILFFYNLSLSESQVLINPHILCRKEEVSVTHFLNAFLNIAWCLSQSECLTTICSKIKYRNGCFTTICNTHIYLNIYVDHYKLVKVILINIGNICMQDNQKKQYSCDISHFLLQSAGIHLIFQKLELYSKIRNSSVKYENNRH